jgi:vacuolar-type H+-ATPase subunit E/Vma4
MATTLEDFVAKLHADGVESGRAEAERLVTEARRQVEAMRHEAESQARVMLAQAEAQAKLLKEQAETELRLAARDTLLQLRASLTSALESILRRALTPVLLDPAVLAELVRHVMVQYASADARGGQRMVVDVPEHLAEALAGWGLAELGASLEGHESYYDVRGVLSEAGFEYHVRGETIDMTISAVADVLNELLRPQLWQLLADAAAQAAAHAAAPAGGPAAEPLAAS